MKFKFISLLGLAALLASCGSFSLAPSASIFSNIEPGIGFEVSGGAIVVVNPKITFQARAGSMGAVINRYKAEFINSGDSYIFPDDFKIEGAIGVNVQPGIGCDAPTPAGCTSFSEGARFEVGPASEERTFAILQAPYAMDMYEIVMANQTANNWRARITFYATAENGTPFEWTEYEPIVFPIRGG